jgi:phage terminase large subunit-like protein
MSIADIIRGLPMDRQRQLVRQLGLGMKDGPKGASRKEIDIASKELGFLDFLEPEEKAFLRYCWQFWARPNQLVDESDPSKTTHLILAGRGFGKSRAGAEWVRSLAETNGRGYRIALIGPTASDTRDIMVKGDSGILAISPPWFMPEYSPSNRRVTWPNGVIATLYSAEEADRLRGPQHHSAWADEICSWKSAMDVWDMLQMGMRLGNDPRTVATTTPKPTELLKDLVGRQTTRIVRGSTYENRSNLAETFIKTIIQRYEGTDLGRQELHAELLLEAKNALWRRDLLAATRVQPGKVTAEDMMSIVVAIDPAVSVNEQSDETGIIVAGMAADGQGYVLADLSGKYTPKQWARVAIKAFVDFEADRIVGEVNNGGDMIRHTLRSYHDGEGLSGAAVPFRAVRASRGKWIRAEPIASLWQQNRCHIVGVMPKLEDQLTSYDPFEGEKSPDRMDSMVWAMTDLMLKGGKRWFL